MTGSSMGEPQKGETMIPDCHFGPALEKAMEWGDRIPIGLFYRREGAVYEDSEPATAPDEKLSSKKDLTGEAEKWSCSW